jgi:hypothetical protein
MASGCVGGAVTAASDGAAGRAQAVDDIKIALAGPDVDRKIRQEHCRARCMPIQGAD